MVKFGEFIMILELHRQGLKVAAIARQLGIDRKTVRKYISRGLEPPTYGPRPHRQKSTDPFLPYLRERFVAFPGLTAVRKRFLRCSLITNHPNGRRVSVHWFAGVLQSLCSLS